MKNQERMQSSRLKGTNIFLVVLVFIVLAFIIILFIYYGYDLIKTLFEKGFSGGIS